MNLIEKTDIQVSSAIGANSIVSKLSNVLKTCEYSKSLTIGIYLVEKNRFLYCNKNLKEILGPKYNTLIKEGWDFWFSLIDSKEVVSIKKRTAKFFTQRHTFDALLLKYHMLDSLGRRICMKHEILLHQIEQHTLAINYFFDVSDKEKIEGSFEGSTAVNGTLFSEKKKLAISDREYEVLELIANGFSSKEIADILFISNHTVLSHRKNLIEKFQVKNTAHLIKKASRFTYL